MKNKEDLKTSFTNYVKFEILNFPWTKIQKQVIFNTLIILNNDFKSDDFVLKNFSFLNKKLYLDLIENFLTKNSYEIIENKNNFKVVFSSQNLNFKLSKAFNNLKENEKIKALIAGLFLGRGWLNSPLSGQYHFELRLNKNIDEKIIIDYFKTFNIKIFYMSKKNWKIFYLKRSSSIADLLRVLNTSQSLISFEDDKISRNFIQSYNKSEKIIKINESKIMESSKKQINSINILIQKNIFININDNLQKISKLRIDFPDQSLSNLTYIFNERYKTNFSKSTINLWFDKIIKLSLK